MDYLIKKRFRLKILSWYKKNGRVYPWRKTDAPFHIIIAEILLKLTGARKAENAYIRMEDAYGSPDRMFAADPKHLREILRPLGLFHRSEMLIGISKEIIERFDGEVPNSYGDLTSIKGIGPYTANAVLCFAFNKRAPLVDGSVARVFKRHFSYHSRKQAYLDKNLWDLASELLPRKHFKANKKHGCQAYTGCCPNDFINII